MLKSLLRVARPPCLAQSSITRAAALCTRFSSPCTARLYATVTLNPSALLIPMRTLQVSSKGCLCAYQTS
ncbi:hypothetical protein BCR37DRAFT_193256 [Protomyces lactucae-debilis]|uniref:Uncharacterized protein n=1 Tax=Protomyces lactucae-debilis TaxID=2754530 RepID=A0A1Y2EU57_PROLT|nr:uncharacterized protein BCR37DRAFT_193256 [Protomyces lactucae-debilis]ORY75098.1 hypothetical protein BCR37DRAFT_193256 [Protomyces lactucae-debilis]